MNYFHFIKFPLGILFLLLSIIVKAQGTYHRIQLTKENGLPSNIIYDIKEASNGLLYIAHSNGLSSFDGFRFVNYYNKEYPYISVSNIMETKNGTIWCKSFNGELFCLRNDTLYYQPLIPNSFYFSYSIADKEYIIGNFKNSIYFYNTELNKIEYKNIDKAESDELTMDTLLSIFSINKSINNQYLIKIDKNHKLYSESINQDRLIVIHHLDKQKPIVTSNKIVQSILNKTKLGILSHKFILLHSVSVNNAIYFDDKLWLCTTKGVFFIDTRIDVDTFHHILKEFNISYAIKDREGNYHFSSLGDGLIRIPSFSINRLSSIPPQITYIHSTSSHLLLGTKNEEVFSYDIGSNTNKVIFKGSSSKPIEFIATSKDNKRIYISSNFGHIIDNNTKENMYFVIKDIFASQGTELIGTNSSIYYRKGNDSLSYLLSQLPQSKYASSNDNFIRTDISGIDKALSVCYDSIQKNLFYTTSDGLYSYSLIKKKRTKLITPSKVITDIKYFNGYLYMGTKDKGLFVFKNNSFIPIKHFLNKGNPSIIFKLYPTDYSLYVHANNAIYKINDTTVVSYDESDGLPITDIKSLVILNHKIYGLTEKDIIYFNEDGIKTDHKFIKIYIKSVKTDHKSLNLSEKVALSYETKNIHIDFHLLSIRNATKTQAAYSINDDEWIPLPVGQREINLNNLVPSSYTLSIAPLVDGILYKDDSVTYEFIIKKPFWQTWWFFSIVGILIAFFTRLAMLSIIRRQRNEFALKKAKMQLENELDKSILSSIKSQMNPHFLFNALNTIQSYIYLNDKKNASIYISNFSELTRSILEMSNKDTVTLDEEINALNLYLELEKMRFEDSFFYKISVDPLISKENTRIPSMLIQPYVENAVKHGLLHKKTNRELHIRFQKKNDKLHIEVDDNGVGRKRSEDLNAFKKKHKSFAMNANKKRLEILQHTFKDLDFKIIDKVGPLGEPLGTMVIIELPM